MAEIGDALLQRYEALERKHAHEVEKLQKQVRIYQGWADGSSK